MVDSTCPAVTRLRFLLRWGPTFVGFIAGGALADGVAGRIHSAGSALLGGALAGLVIGGGQWLALWPWLRSPTLCVAGSALGQAVGLTVGAALVGYETDAPSLTIQGAATGVGVGVCQAYALREHGLH